MKMDILRDGHYVYNFDQELFVNPEARKAFSFPFIDDHAEDELVRYVHEPNDGQKWKFYFNVPPTERAIRELEKVLM